MEGAPVVKVSAATGQGLDELTDTIQQLMSDEVVAKDTQTIPRLPIDRAFTLSGFGTIITGTLISGTITRKTFWKCIRSEKSARSVIFRYMGRIRTNAMPDREWRSICQM